jgi:hypothetical protein
MITQIQENKLHLEDLDGLIQLDFDEHVIKDSLSKTRNWK